jgi:hypothetical protein
MGAKTWMLVGTPASARDAFRAQPALDHEATMGLAKRLFPKEQFDVLGAGDLGCTCPPDDELHIGSFPGVTVVSASEFGIDYPSQLDQRFLSAMDSRTIYLHAMHSVVDWFAFGVWREGKLERSLSLSPESGVMEDIGPRYSFELPYWSGEHPAVDPEEEENDEDAYPFPFHPLDLGEAALKEFFGYQLEGLIDDTLLQPESIELVRLKRKKSRFRLW